MELPTSNLTRAQMFFLFLGVLTFGIALFDLVTLALSIVSASPRPITLAIVDADDAPRTVRPRVVKKDTPAPMRKLELEASEPTATGGERGSSES